MPTLADYVAAIETALTREFGGALPRILIEPGRYLVGDAGLLRTEVLLISRKSLNERERWVYLEMNQAVMIPATNNNPRINQLSMFNASAI